jgi:hypothetical protein
VLGPEFTSQYCPKIKKKKPEKNEDKRINTTEVTPQFLHLQSPAMELTGGSWGTICHV